MPPRKLDFESIVVCVSEKNKVLRPKIYTEIDVYAPKVDTVDLMSYIKYFLFCLTLVP